MAEHEYASLRTFAAVARKAGFICAHSFATPSGLKASKGGAVSLIRPESRLRHAVPTWVSNNPTLSKAFKLKGWDWIATRVIGQIEFAVVAAYFNTGDEADSIKEKKFRE